MIKTIEVYYSAVLQGRAGLGAAIVVRDIFITRRHRRAIDEFSKINLTKAVHRSNRNRRYKVFKDLKFREPVFRVTRKTQ